MARPELSAPRKEEGFTFTQKPNSSESSTIMNGNSSHSLKDEGANSHSTALLQDDPFSNETSKRLFNAIDELRTCGASPILDLPQLVIVGQQSAGKSSLLRSLTDIPFPVQDGLCTRFATRIVSRRTLPGTADIVSVSVERGDIDPFGYPEDDEPTGIFNPPIPSSTAIDFKNIVRQASDFMGIRPHDELRGKNFSSKVLKIELAGPNRSHFGILDVPGIFRAKKDGVTDQEMKGVEKLVTSYMKKKENFIICVVPANNDLANQEIIDLALEHAGQSRVVGVFTKCDEIPDRTISSVVEVVRDNKQKPLQNGYFVVQNQQPGAPESDREKEENATFSKDQWLSIPAHQRGTAALKKYLANTLCKRIREVFPGMKATIVQLLSAERNILQQLGEARPQYEDRHKYLRRIARRYQALAYQAWKAQEELPSDEMKLHGMVRTADDNFAEKIKTDGHFFAFQDMGKDDADPSILLRVSSGNAAPLYKEIHDQIDKNRGEELQGMINPKVLKPLFNKQTTNWEPLGEAHLRKVVSMSKDVAMRILDLVSAEFGISEDVRNFLEEIISQFTDRGEKQTLEDLRSFCDENKTRPLKTNNDTFKYRVKYAQHRRFKAALQRYRSVHKTEDYLVALHPEKDRAAVNSAQSIFGSWAIVDLDNLDDLFEEMHPRGIHNTEDEIHDLLWAYYEVARTWYIDYVTRHIELSFLEDLKGPLFGFSEEYIQSLSRDQVDLLGGEDASIVASRKRAEQKIRELEEAMKIADQALSKTRGF